MHNSQIELAEPSTRSEDQVIKPPGASGEQRPKSPFTSAQDFIDASFPQTLRSPSTLANCLHPNPRTLAHGAHHAGRGSRQRSPTTDTHIASAPRRVHAPPVFKPDSRWDLGFNRLHLATCHTEPTGRASAFRPLLLVSRDTILFYHKGNRIGVFGLSLRDSHTCCPRPR